VKAPARREAKLRKIFRGPRLEVSTGGFGNGGGTDTRKRRRACRERLFCPAGAAVLTGSAAGERKGAYAHLKM